MLVALIIFLFICIVVGATVVLGAPGLILLPVGVVIAGGLLVSSMLGSRRAPSQVLRDAPEADLLGPGGPDDPARESRRPPANAPEAPAPGERVTGRT